MKVSDLALNLYSYSLPRQLNTGAEKSASGKEKQVLTEDEKRLMETCRDFEAIFLGELLKSMRKTIPQGGLLEKSFGQDVFESMLDTEYARIMAQSRSTGLAEILYQQLTHYR